MPTDGISAFIAVFEQLIIPAKVYELSNYY